MGIEAKRVIKTEQNGWKPLSRAMAGELLRNAGLPENPTHVTKREFIGTFTDEESFVEERELAFYVGSKAVDSVDFFSGGYPIIICEKGDKENWYFGGIEGKHPDECTPEEYRDFFNQAIQLVSKTNRFTPYIFEHFAKQLEGNIRK